MKKIYALMLVLVLCASNFLTVFAIENDVVQRYNVNVLDLENGTIKVLSNEKIKENEKVIMEVLPTEGFEVGEVEVMSESGNLITVNEKDLWYEFIMPAENCVAYATFIEKKAGTISEELVLEEILENVVIDDDKNKTIITRSTVKGIGIEYFGKVTYSATTVGAFTINGNIAFCMEHQKPTPDTGTSFGDSVYNNADIRKVLYYGWAGPEQWGGFGSYEQGVVVTSLALSYYYSGADTMGMQKHGTSSRRIGLSDFFNYIESKEDIPNNKVFLDKNRSSSYLTADKGAQRSEDFTLQADGRNSIMVPLESGMSLVNVTTGVTTTGNAVVKGGETFYLTAPLSMNDSMWTTGSMVGSMQKFNAVLAITGSAGLQDLGYGQWAIDPTNTVSLTVDWKAIGYVSVKKVDAETGLGVGQGTATLAGAEYTLFTNQACTTVAKDISGNDIRFITDSNGMAPKSNRIVFGTYYLKETKAPNGYLLNDEVITITLPETDSDPFDVLITSKDKPQKGVIKLEKLDSETNNNEPQGSGTLKGAEYTVTNLAGNVVDTLVTDIKGKAESKELLLGRYVVKEIKSPEGYLLDNKEYVVDITSENRTDAIFTHKVTSKDKPQRGDFEIIKYAQPAMEEEVDLQKPLVGVEFTLEHHKTGEKVVIVTDEKGKATTVDENFPNGRLLYGKWTVSETGVPEGFTAIKTFVIDIANQGDFHSYIAENKRIRSAIRIVKVDSMTQQPIGLKHMEFKIVNIDTNKDVVFTQRYPSNEKITVLTTNENGACILPQKLDYGNYALVEITAPEGYLNNEVQVLFKVDSSFDWEKPLVVQVENKTVMGKISIQKNDAVTKQGIMDTVFSVFAKEDIVTPDNTVRYKKGDLVEVLKTNVLGQVVSQELFLGAYDVVETKQSDGYLVENRTYTVNLTYKDQVTALVTESIEVFNKPTTLIINKLDLQSNEPMKDVVFVLQKVSKEDIDPGFTNERQFYTTDESGNITIKYLRQGEYILGEFKQADGYLIDKTQYYITVNGKGEIEVVEKHIDKEHNVEITITEQKDTVTISVKNDYTKLQISKIDMVDDKELAGAELQILKASNREIVEKWISTDKPHVVTKLVPDTYILKEILAPNGMLVAEEIEFVLLETGKVQHVVMKDEHAHGVIEVTKQDSRTSALLDGAEFQIIASQDIKTKNGTVLVEKNTVVDTITTVNGIVSSKELFLGKYEIKETKAPSGYELCETVYPIELKYENQYTKVVIEKIIIVNNQIPKQEIVKTGDSAKMLVILISLCISAISIGIVLVKRKQTIHSR